MHWYEAISESCTSTVSNTNFAMRVRTSYLMDNFIIIIIFSSIVLKSTEELRKTRKNAISSKSVIAVISKLIGHRNVKCSPNVQTI